MLKLYPILVLIFSLKLAGCIFLGKSADIGDFPYAVSVYEDDDHACGGVIIDQNTVLTAAHCIEENHFKYTYTIRAGSTQHNKGHRHSIKLIIKHKSHNKTIENDYDIAILKLSRKLRFNSNTRPILLQEPTKKSLNGTVCHVAGWGLTEKDLTSPNLKTAKVKIITNKDCGEYFDSAITSNMICARTLKHHRLDLRTQQVGQGDSGGPLVCDDRLVGIVSFVYEFIYPDSPSAYTKISSVRDWIINTSRS